MNKSKSGGSETKNRYGGLLDPDERSRTLVRLAHANRGLDREKAQRAVEDIINGSKGVVLGPTLTIKGLINEGRR